MRYFAAAKAVLGRAGDSFDTDVPTTLGALEQRLADADPEAGAVLARCSYLVDGVSSRDRALVLAADARVDVLPPFAGG